MDIQYDAEREPLAAMKLAAEAHGAERLRWIDAALAWIELHSPAGACVRPREWRNWVCTGMS